MSTRRINQTRQALRAQELDALLVTHPPNLRYLTGVAVSAGAALVTPTVLVLIVDSRYITAATDLLSGSPDVRVQLAVGSMDDAVGEAVRSEGVLRVGVEAEHLSLARFNRLRARGAPSGAGSVTLVPTERIIERLRAVKDAREIATLRTAARHLSRVARGLAGRIAVGQSEIEVAALVDAAVREAGFERAAFDTIVASGPNSALPHARPTHRKLGEGEPVVLDFGGVYDGYCVDLTRTLHIGPASPQFCRLFEAVREARAAAIEAVRPGALPADVDAAARRTLERYGLAEAFGHGTGHGLGLEVHEEPRISPLAPAGEPIAAGMVFTIEPGVYVPGTGGVRIEDDVLVVADGCEILTDVPIDFQTTDPAPDGVRQVPGP